MITVNGRTCDERIKGDHDYGDLLYTIDRIASPFTLSEVSNHHKTDAFGTPLYHVDDEGNHVPTMEIRRPQTLEDARDNKTALLAAYEGSKDVQRVDDRGFGSTPQQVRENKLRVDHKLKAGRKYMSLATKLNHVKFVRAKKKEMVNDEDGREVPMGMHAAEEAYARALDSAWTRNLALNPYWDQCHWPEWFASLMSSPGDTSFQRLVDPANACNLGIFCAWEPHRQMQLMNHMMPITALMRATAAPTVLDTATALRSYFKDVAQGTTAEEREAQKAARLQAYAREMADRARKSRTFTTRSWRPVSRRKAREIEGNTLQYQRVDCGDTQQESLLTEASVAPSVVGLAKADGKRRAEPVDGPDDADSDLDDPALVRRRKARAAKAARIAA